jgi:fatty acid desaturase
MIGIRITITRPQPGPRWRRMTRRSAASVAVAAGLTAAGGVALASIPDHVCGCRTLAVIR